MMEVHNPRLGRSRRCASTATLLFVLLGFVTAAPVSASGADWPKARPGSVGMSAERLERLGEAMQAAVDAGKAPGIVVLVARNGKAAFFRAFGKLSLETGVEMPPDGIFRIASQSKAITSVAIMTLVEEGRILLHDPVSRFIPEFKDARVAVAAAGKDNSGYATVPVKRAITIRDLLTHTAGISYGTGLAAKEYEAAGVQGWFFADKDVPIGDCIRKVAGLPFDSQPGEAFVYGFNTDILGHIVEIVSGLSLADYVRGRITEPLKMTDTCFYLPGEKANRLTTVYAAKDGTLAPLGGLHETAYDEGPCRCYSGGAGLLSTASDYARFLQMLLNGGELDGTRILSPKTVELMTVDHAGPIYGGGKQGFGLGFWVTEDLGLSGDYGTVGAFGWGGAYHTTYWVDPVEKLVAVFMVQLLPPLDGELQPLFKTLVYQSIVESYAQR
jgi:CubicO group peptidase (beta-lactamase class C family)